MLSLLHQQLFNRQLHTAVMKGMTSLVILLVCVRVMVAGLSPVSVILPAKVMLYQELNLPKYKLKFAII